MSNVVIDLTKTVKEIITTMKTAIDNLNSDVAANKTAIDNLNSDVAANKTAIDNLNTDVSSNKTAIDNLNTDVSSRPVYYLDSDGCLCETIFVEVTE